MRINRKIAGYTLLAALAILVLVVLALPPLIRHIAVKKIDEATGRKSQISKVSLNPFTLSAAISGLKISEKGSGATFLSLSSARLSLSPLSLPKRSFIITELQLASPYLHIVRNAPNNFNISDLMTGKGGEKPARGGGTPLFSLNNITIKNGSIDFQDRALGAEKLHSVREMAISIPFITNTPYLAERYVTPHFSAVVNGSPFDLQGRLQPLTKSVEATVSLDVKHLDIPFYLGYLPVPPPVKVNSGQLSTALELGYRVDQKTGPELKLSGLVALERISLSEPQGGALANLDRGRLKIADIALFARRYHLASLELDGMELFVSRDQAGSWNFKRIGNAAKKPGAEPEQQAEKEPSDLKLDQATINAGKLHFSDALAAGGFKTDLQQINLKVSNFASRGQRALFDLNFATARKESAALKGDFAADPVDFKANLTLKGIPLKDYYPYLSETLTAPVSGTLGVSAELSYKEPQGLVIEQAALKGEGISAPFGPRDGLRLDHALVSGITVNLKHRKAAVDRVDLKGGKVTLSSEKGGTLSAQRLLRSKEQSAAPQKKGGAAKDKVARGRAAAAPPFSYWVEKVAGTDLDVRFTDRTLEEEPAFSLNRLNFSLTGISGPKQGAIPFTLATGYGKGGRISASGNLTPAPLALNGKLELQKIPLRDFDAYLNRNTTVFIADGALDTKMSVKLERGAAGFKGSYNGSLGVHSFYCQDTVLEEDLLKWERLQLDQLSGTLGPFTLAIGDVSLSNFYSRIIIRKDGTLNLQHLKVEEKQAAAPQATPAQAQATQAQAAPTQAAPTQAAPTQAAPTQAAPTQAAPTQAAPAQVAAGVAVSPAPSTAPPEAGQPRPVRIDAITMQGGTLDFSDRHLEAPFDTTFFNLGGRVSGLSSQSNRFADVDLRGNLENHSPLAITGVINPLRGDLFLDLKIAFSDIELSPFTPYSDTYLGYHVDKGKLSLDLNYRIDKKALSSQNKVFIDQFAFGEAVESAKATKLPVRLAVALLKDRKGEIHLDLPVTGRTDDPKFSVWKVMLQMLRNLLAKAATSPFALLGSVFGGGEDFSAVSFAPGSARLAKPEQDKLTKLSQALAERPALNLEISGFVDRERDAEGYRSELILKKMRGEKFRALVKQGKTREGQTLEETEIQPEEQSQYLKAVYVKEKFPKPRTALGFLKDLPDAEMRKLLMTNTLVGNDELQTLARERAEAVKEYLLKEGKVPAQRVFEKSADIYKPSAKEGGGGSRVEFGASAK